MNSFVCCVLTSAFLMGSSGAGSASLPRAEQTLRKTLFCQKYRCIPQPDTLGTPVKTGQTRSSLRLAGKALERFYYLSEVSLDATFQKTNAQNKGGLVRLALNLQSSIPGDGATPKELEDAFGQMRRLTLEFTTQFLPAKAALEQAKKCDFASGKTLNTRIRVEGQNLRLTCDFFTFGIEVL
ncbi:MAG: hypothetical protein H7095_03540 [Pseudopedobacter sp.]|nr:hypothetical protein [Deinococcales bacterium]